MGKGPLADVSAISGKKFTASSGNIGVVSTIEAGASRVTWKKRPSQQDSDEFLDWVSVTTRQSLQAKISYAGKIGESANQKERADLEFWKKEIQKDTNE